MPRKVSWLWDMVTGTFHSFRSLDRDEQIDRLSDLLYRESGERDRAFIGIYAAVLTYTIDLDFNWPEGTPDDYRALETFWEMKQAGKSEIECFRYYAGHVNNIILLGEHPAAAKRANRKPVKDWQDAYTEALEAWIPPAWKLKEELTDEERSSPLSSSSASTSVPT